jgi:hypothetical protein
MHRITLECLGIPSSGRRSSAGHHRAFSLHYPHENKVICTFDHDRLRLIAINDHDPEGLNLLDEFSDTISAHVEPFDGDIKIVSVEAIG